MQIFIFLTLTVWEVSQRWTKMMKLYGLQNLDYETRRTNHYRSNNETIQKHASAKLF